MIKRICLIMVLLTFINLVGCFPYTPDYYPEEELKVSYVRNRISYEYSEKVVVMINHSDEKDDLKLATTANDDWWYSTYSILSGEFEKVTWVDYNLIVLCEGTYYTFDIKNYEITPLNDNGKLDETAYELNEYSESEFKELFPEWESFDWYGH